MRIAIFSDFFYPEIGGIQDSVAALGRALSKRGHELVFFVPEYSGADYAKAKVKVKEINLGQGVKVKRFFSFSVPSPTQQSRLVLPYFFRWLEAEKFNPDIIHTHSFFGLGLEALAASYFLKKPLLGTNHWVITEFNRYSPMAAKIFADLSLKSVVWYYNRCDFVTAPSESVFVDMKEKGFKKPYRVVSNQIDLEIFKPLSPAEIKKAKNEFGLSNSTVVFAGRLGGEKNIDTVIRAVAKAKEKITDINLAIAGHGSAKAELSRLAEKLGVGERVKFLGTLSQFDLARLYNASEVFAIASTSESQSMVLLQAMACGLPVLGARWRALPEYINEKNGFLFEPYNHEELAEKIVRLLSNPEERKVLGKGGLEFVKQFGADAIAEKWENIYKEVLNKK